MSGFNVEYGSGGFTLIFIAEYSMIIFLSFIRVLLNAVFFESKFILSASVFLLVFF